MEINKDMLKDMIVPTVWTDKDVDIIVQYNMDKLIGLESVDELSK